MPLISVIIPVYNGEKTIRKTIESVLNQIYSNFELIVINDGSKDSTLDILASIQDPRLKVFSYTNAGVSASRNRGFSLATGEFIALLDADDLWTPDKLEAQLRALQENPKAVVSYSWTDNIDESGQFLSSGSRTTLSGDIYADLLAGNFLSSGSNPLIRAYAWTEVGGFDESLTHAEDWDMWIRLAARYHFVAVPLPQILYRVSANSASVNTAKIEAASLEVIKRAYNQAPKSLHHLKSLTLTNLYKYLIWRIFESSPGRQGGLVAARYLWHFLSNDPSRFRHVRYKFSLLFKIALLTLITPKSTVIK